MSYTDALSTFALAEALSGGGAGTEIIGNTINLVDARDIGSGRPVYLVITAATDLAGAGTVAFELKTGAADPVSAGDDTIIKSPAYVGNDVDAGDVLFQTTLPLEGQPYEQYLALAETVVGAAVSGSINAYLTIDPVKWEAYPEGRN